MIVCKQNPAVSRKFRSVNISSYFGKSWNKNAHTSDIVEVDKMEEGKGMFECQIYA